MLYDMKIHLPQIIDKMVVEDMRAGDIDKLETDKMIVTKFLSGCDNFDVKIKLIEDEYKKRRDKSLSSLEENEKNRVNLMDELLNVQRDYWESVIGEIKRTVDKATPVNPTEVEVEDE